MSTLAISTEAVDRLLADVRLHGATPAETGGFLIARPQDPDRIELLALAGEHGVRRARDLFEVTGAAIERLFTWAADNELAIRAQVHSHRKHAFLSPTDVRHGFSVDGFISCVVPQYAAPPAEAGEWGWWECQGGRWARRPSPAVVRGTVDLVRFDAGGVDAD